MGERGGIGNQLRFLLFLDLRAASPMSDAAMPPTTIPGIMKEKINPM
jgi:hypothetical protein